MKLLCLALIVLSVLALSVTGKDKSADLTTLTAQFHSIINELGNGGLNTDVYEAEAAALLKKLEQLQYPGAVHNISLDWFSGSIAQVTPLRVIIVVSSFEGMYLNSGIGTFYAALSDFLVSRGHTVTVLYTRTDNVDTTSKTFTRWQSNYAKRGVSVVRLEPLPVHVTSAPLTQRSYQVYQYLKEHQQDFDVAHFPEWEGPGYFSVLAKHQHLAFLKNTFIVGLHGPWRWVKHGNQKLGLTEPQDLETDWLERRSVELADFVVTPSVDLPQWLASQGWSFADYDINSRNKLSLMPFLPGREVQMLNQRQTTDRSSQKTNVAELVFFGRLETRKGITLFADALDILSQRRPNLEGLKVTFMGRSADIGGETSTKYLGGRAKTGKWPFKLTFATHKDRKAGLEYLKDETMGRVAVIPSLLDNAPYTAYECLYSKIPFIASNLPSIAALVAPSHREDVLFAVEATSLADKIEQIIDGGVIVPQGLLSADAAVKAWGAFYSMVSLRVREFAEQAAHPPASAVPKVSVCMTHFNRPELLAMALQSVQAQDYPQASIEVVLVDDGSTSADAISYIESLGAEFERNSWKIIKTENKYLGAARNTAARHASGEYLLFLDDDNLAKSNQISTYASVAQVTGADVLTAAHDVFKGYGLPKELPPDSNIVSRSIPLGPAVSLGVFKNCFGDANFFIKRHVFAQAGGFTEERGVGQEDYEFLADAVLSGLQLEAIPEPLLYYRMHDQSKQMISSTDPVANQVRSARPFKAVMDESPETSETLTLLARRHSIRYAQNVAVDCNMTVTKIQPPTFKTLTRTIITFTAHTMDCMIKDIKIGSYTCANVTQVSGNNTFQCVAPPLPFPGTYSVTLKFAESVDPKKLDQKIVVELNASVSTVAAVMVKYIADLSLYTSEKLFHLFSQLGNFPEDIIGIIDDLILQPGEFKRSVLATSSFERHDMRFALTSSDQGETATELAVHLIQVALANRDEFLKIGVTLLDFNLIGKCDVNMNCACTPSYSGEGCGDSASCPENCSGNGQCVDGPYSRVCECNPGYAGRDCSTITCVNDCSGHGACRMVVNGTTQCLCDAGWKGDDCHTAGCTNNCNGRGTCDEGKGVCNCKSGWTGVDCRYHADNIGRDGESASSSEDLGVTIGMSIAAGVAGLALLAAIALAVYLRRLKH